MGTLLSAISGQFAKVVTLGTLFPVLIISILNVVVVTTILPNSGSLQAQFKRIALGESTWSAVALTFVVVVVTGVLYNLNNPIIRLYEGYPWAASWIGELITNSKKKQFREARTLCFSSRYLIRNLSKAGGEDQRISALTAQYTRLARILSTEVPDVEEYLLPTRLGNIIRCFERYSTAAYGIDAIVLWPRLLSKIDSTFASTIDEAKASFDFMLNCSFLSLLTAIGIVVIGLLRSTPLALKDEAAWIWRAFLFGGISVVFYHFSLGRAKAWGDQVRAAFDLYRFDLLKSLGYLQQPILRAEEVAVWSKISAQLLYAQLTESPLPYKDLLTRIDASPTGIEITVTREYGAIQPNGHILVRITIENADKAQRQAVAIKLIETLPDGFKYAPETAQLFNGTLHVSSLVPLEFVIHDPLAPQDQRVVTYEIKPSP